MKFCSSLRRKLIAIGLYQEHNPVSKEVIGIPVNKSSWYLTHTECVFREFEFLNTEFQFEMIMDRHKGHELWIVYAKPPIEIQIWGDHGDLPFIMIRNSNLPYDESKELDNRDSVDEQNPKVLRIRQGYDRRRAPLHERFMYHWLKKDNYDSSELDKDYELFGKQEHEEYIREAALTVRHSLMLNRGVLKNVT